jgi:hypothetical protein
VVVVGGQGGKCNGRHGRCSNVHPLTALCMLLTTQPPNHPPNQPTNALNRLAASMPRCRRAQRPTLRRPRQPWCKP